MKATEPSEKVSSIDIVISENIRELIKKKGKDRTGKEFKAYQLARICKIKPNDLNSRLNNKSHWRMNMLRSIADYFGLTIDDLTRKGKAEPNKVIMELRDKVASYEVANQQAFEVVQKLRQLQGEKNK